MNIILLKSSMNLFNVLNKFQKSSVLFEDLKNTNSKFKLDAKKTFLVFGLFWLFLSNPLKAQTFFFTPGWGSAPCSVEYRVYDASSALILQGVDNAIRFPIPNPPIQNNCFAGIPSYVEFIVNGGSPITVAINSSTTVPLICLGGAQYTFAAYFTPSGLGCPQETLIMNY